MSAGVHHLPGVCSVVIPPAFPSKLYSSRRPAGSQISLRLLFCPFPAGCRMVFTVATNKKAIAVPSAQAEPFLSRAVAVTCGVVPEESAGNHKIMSFTVHI